MRVLRGVILRYGVSLLENQMLHTNPTCVQYAVVGLFIIMLGACADSVPLQPFGLWEVEPSTQKQH